MKIFPATAILILLFFVIAGAEELFPFQGIVKEDGINIRRDSTVSSEIIGSANKGQELTVIREAYDWYKIRFPSDTPADQGGFAWIHKKFVERKPQVAELPLAEITAQAPQPQPQPQAGQQGEGEITITGIVAPYGKVFGRKATHKLISQDKEIFLLKGDKKELDSFNYRKVKVSGVKSGLPENKKFPVIEIIALEEIK